LYGIFDYDKLSENIKDAIFDPHSDLSKGIDENEGKIGKLKEVLGLIDLAIT